MTEQDYFDTFNSPTSFSNYSFLHLLREHSAIFVGLSLTDQNLRRLLHYSYLDGEKDIAARRLKLGPDSNLRQRHVALLSRKGSQEVDDALEGTLGALGVHVEWLNDHDEIPTFPKTVYEAADCGRWDDVYL